jgi:2-(1,2-epoxy-1,2-dihydrophenyl)acetyl-CoA isomerase
MAYETIQYEKRDHVAVLTLNRPDRLNALNGALLSELHQIFDAARLDDQVRALVVTGAGRGFCSGADVGGGGGEQASRGGFAGEEGQSGTLDPFGWTGRLAKRFGDFDKPLIGAINGVCAGAGMSFALACDVRVGSENARFKTVFIERGLTPEAAMSFYLPRIVGYSRAADLIFTSRAVDAQEALRIGLLDRLVDQAVLVEEAVNLANEMTGWPPLALRMAKRALKRNQDAEFEAAIQYESTAVGFARRAKNDSAEAMKAFREKRKPSYTGS